MITRLHARLHGLFPGCSPGLGDPCNPSASPQVLSGCAIIVRGQPRGGPPPERQINLSNIRAGNLARRAAAGQPDAKDTPDEVGASRERSSTAPLPRGSRADLDGGLQAAGPALWTAAPSARGIVRSQSRCGRPSSPTLSPCPGRCGGRMKPSLRSFKRSFPCSSPTAWILGQISPSLPRCGRGRAQDGVGIARQRGQGLQGQGEAAGASKLPLQGLAGGTGGSGAAALADWVLAAVGLCRGEPGPGPPSSQPRGWCGALAANCSPWGVLSSQRRFSL